MHFVDMDMYDYKVFKSLTQPLLCDYVTAFRDSKLPVLVQEAFRRLLSTSLVVKNIYFHATRAQEVDSTNWKEIKKKFSSVAGPKNKQTAISFLDQVGFDFDLQVGKERGEGIAREHNISFLETSAKVIP